MAQLTPLDDEFTVLVNRAIRRTAERVADVMRQNIPVDTGALRDSVVVEHTGAWEYRVYPTATDNGFPYGVVANTGRGEVVPKRAKALRYKNGTFSKYSSPYSGSHFVQNTVNTFR